MRSVTDMAELKDHMYTYAIAYLRIYGESMQGEIIESFRRSFPEECERRSVFTLRNYMTREISRRLKWEGADAPIQRTGNKTIVLREGYAWPEA